MPRTLCDETETLGKLFGRLKKKFEAGELNEDEPCFLLRAQDALAPHTVRHWCWLMTQNSGSQALKADAYAILEAMERWPNRKLPD